MKKKSQPNIQTVSSSLFTLACYVRVSTDEQANVIEGSLDNQRHRMQTFVDIKNMQEPGWGKIIEFYIDDGYSAKDTNRPAYGRMMKDLKSGKVNAIMVTELSRLSRNIPDFCDFHKLLDDHGAKFFSIKEQFDSSTPSGKMMLYNMINLAQFEREQTSERVAINCHSRASRGLLNGGPAILGYDRDPAKKATLIVNKAEAENVRKIFNLFIEHRGLCRTIDVLESQKITPKPTASTRKRLAKQGRWTVDSLSSLLKNQSYIAIREVNKGNKHLDQLKLKPWQRYECHPASWPAIVDVSTFKSANQILGANHERERMRLDTSSERVFAASGVCTCEECGRRLVGQSAHGRSHVHRYYVHSSKRGDVIGCSVKRIKADKIEAAISNHLANILLEAGYFEKIELRIKALAAQSPEQLKHERRRINSELRDIDLAIKNTFKIQAALDAKSEAIRETAKELDKLSRTKRHLEAEMEALQAKVIEEEDVDDAVNNLKENLEAFRRGWKRASAIVKKSLLQDLLQSVLVGPEGLSIQYRLKHGLSKNITADDLRAANKSQNIVIEMKDHSRKPPKGNAAISEINNLSIIGSQVLGFGSEGGI